jgi:hypothetical protein
MILAEVSSGRSDFDEARQPRIAGGRDRLDRRRAALARRLEGGGAHRQNASGVGRLHHLDGVAGVDRPLEGVGRNHLGDLGDLHHVEQRGDPRQHVLRHGRGGGDDGVVGGRQRHDQRGHRLGHLVGERGVVGGEHLGDARQRGGLGRGAGDAGTRDQHMDVATDLRGGGERLEGGVLDGGAVVFGDQKNGHDGSLLRSRRLRSSACRPARRPSPP